MSITKKKSVLFLNLVTFRQTGGIEKINRTVMKAFNETANQNSQVEFNAISVYDSDSQVDERYIDKKRVINCAGNKFLFFLKTLSKFFTADTILLNHVNLIPLVFPLKVLAPHKPVYMYAYGIDVWNLTSLQKKLMQLMNVTVISLSRYTSKMLKNQFKNFDLKMVLINPCLDPFLKYPTKLTKQTGRFNNQADRLVFLTLTRLSAKEQYKGYDRAIEALAKVREQFPNFLYIIAGKADPSEKERVEKIIQKHGLENHVLLTGFVPDEHITELFLSSDLHIMPSQNEGFGITFIEASLFGLRNIAGNIDGSPDAVLDGKLGDLINPNNVDEIVSAIQKNINNKEQFTEENRARLQRITLEHFSFERYKQLITGELLK